MGALPESTLRELLQAADDTWERHRRRQQGEFHGFVPSDHRDVHDRLARLRDRHVTFVELGSGTGVNTILADLLGYEAYGIEIEPWLVDAAEELAERFESEARFAQGSFLPGDFDAAHLIDGDFHVTYDDAHSAWGELDRDLADFDLVFAFPWPGEEDLFERLLAHSGRPGQLLLTWHADEGFRERVV
jgi:hypothetical protein